MSAPRWAGRHIELDEPQNGPAPAVYAPVSTVHEKKPELEHWKIDDERQQFV